MADTTAPKPVTKRYRTRRLPFIFYIPGFLWRNKLPIIAILPALYAVDRLYGPQAVNYFAGPPLVTVDAKFCQTETCTATARNIATATALWIRTAQTRGYSVPDYLNPRYAIGSTGIESDMGANIHKAGSRYRGVLQLSPQIDDTHFTDIAGELFETLKAAYAQNPDAIPALYQLKINGKLITAKQLQELFAEKITIATLPANGTRTRPLRYATNKLLQMIRDNRAVFIDPTIQTFAFMEASYKSLKDFKDKPHFIELPEIEQHAILYLAHNHPRMARVVLKQQYCERPVSELSPRDVRYFPGNSGIYSSTGIATPAQVKYRVMKRMYAYLNVHGPKLGDAKLATSIAPVEPRLEGHKGIFHRLVIRSLINRTRCVPDKLES
ncbi:MAG: hypothetical protein SFW65_05715 [Alphaproteobacteria bacterium]|nr:hypothetical protein [Alphaproteobacteria bacterium]